MENSGENEDNEGSSANQADLLKSYLAFGRRAIGKRKPLAFLIFISVVVLASVALAVWPRTYSCDLRLLVRRSEVLDRDEKTNPLESASDVISRRENVEALAAQLDLVKEWDSSRAPVLKLKDRFMEILRGKPRKEDMSDVLVDMLESRLWANAEGHTLVIGVDWPDPKTAKRIVDAAKDSFLQSRHNSEISVIEEKMSILEGHATKLRTEIEGIARELGRAREDKLAEAEKAARRVSQAAIAPAAAAPPPAARRTSAASVIALGEAVAEPAADLTEVKEELDGKRRKLSDLQSRRNQSLLEAKGRLSELKFKYTSDHPDVRSSEQRVALLSEAPPEETALAAEVAGLEGRVKRGTASAKAAASAGAPLRGFGGGAAPSHANAAEALPAEILKLIDNSDEMDPAVSAQLSTALSKYGELRGEIRTQRITLDTAQAAFNYRYNIVSPASAPSKPSKPKVPLVLAAGLAAALALALLIPLILELKTGIIVELWQVHQIPVRMLGEVRLPTQNR